MLSNVLLPPNLSLGESYNSRAGKAPEYKSAKNRQAVYRVRGITPGKSVATIRRIDKAETMIVVAHAPIL